MSYQVKVTDQGRVLFECTSLDAADEWAQHDANTYGVELGVYRNGARLYVVHPTVGGDLTDVEK